MNKEWDKDKGGRDLPSGIGPWLAGFVDGEGNFDIHRQRRKSGEYFYCRFELSLRADDGGVLQMLQRTFGGKVYYGSPGEGQNEKARWELVAREECLRLVDLLDRFPLQSKKARDFAIWREALAVSCAHAGTPRPDLMLPFWEALRGTRPYAGKATDPIVFREMENEHRWIAWLAGIMAECYRLLKPGAHALVWALPRTSHWTAIALEEAGFEIRDVGVHLFGTGFPKSLDVSKAIDRAAGAERTETEWYDRYKDGVTRQTQTQANQHIALAPGKNGNLRMRPATEAARQWEGWGTALKPAAEHWILARKPLNENTVAANVLEWGTGALNIDGCRIALDPNHKNDPRLGGKGTWTTTRAQSSHTVSLSAATLESSTLGRWPANVTLDEEAAAVLDTQSGERPSGRRENSCVPQQSRFSMGRFRDGYTHGARGYSDSGGASRFFYTAKASRADREYGCENLPKKGSAANHHPTVKPQSLMRWLTRLITPPDGLILDPFAGTGSTGIAALLEGFRFIGVEASPEYTPIAKARLVKALKDTETGE